MTQFLCFSGGYDEFVPGGWNDFDGTADTVEAAKALKKEKADWAHIVSLETLEEVCSWHSHDETGAYGVVTEAKNTWHDYDPNWWKK